ncbi:MAG TPA: TIGR02449 family protein [Gammaproteobacteria bacterium]|nr:TIGR02449 family protein [Gammaproteobacteria bacterium]
MELSTLEKRIDELIAFCDQLERKQESIATEQEKWLQERSRLLEKNELAKTKIEAMIMRLKSLDQD